VKKVLFLIEALHPGGAERQLINLMNGLANLDVEVYLVTWISKNHYSQEYIPKVTWYQVQRKAKFDLSVFRYIRKQIKKLDIQVVQGFLDTGNLYAYLSCYGLKGVRVYGSERSSERHLGRFVRIHKPFVHKRLDLTICNSETGKRFVDKITNGQVRSIVIRNGFDTERFRIAEAGEKAVLRKKLGLKETGLNLICVGRVIPLKRQLELVKAFHQSQLNEQDLRLLLIGEQRGEYAEEVINYIHLNGLGESIQLVPPQKNIEEYYKASEIFILISKYEGSPNALAEALLSGLTVINTNCGDSSFYMDGTIGSYTVEPFSEDALANSLILACRIEGHERLNNSVANRNQMLVEKQCDNGNMIRAYFKTYFGNS
jgi:glycosyltransferase involved in cell wall biosynthesis